MNAHADSEQPLAAGSVTLALEPDILTLAQYLARKTGMSLEAFLEYLITKEAAKGRYPGSILASPQLCS